jgi:hypothetical protein
LQCALEPWIIRHLRPQLQSLLHHLLAFSRVTRRNQSKAEVSPGSTRCKIKQLQLLILLLQHAALLLDRLHLLRRSTVALHHLLLLREHRFSLLIALRIMANLIRADRISSTDGSLICRSGGIDTVCLILFSRLLQIVVWIFKTLRIVVIVA